MHIARHYRSIAQLYENNKYVNRIYLFASWWARILLFRPVSTRNCSLRMTNIAPPQQQEINPLPHFNGICPKHISGERLFKVHFCFFYPLSWGPTYLDGPPYLISRPPHGQLRPITLCGIFHEALAWPLAPSYIVQLDKTHDPQFLTIFFLSETYESKIVGF